MVSDGKVGNLVCYLHMSGGKEMFVFVFNGVNGPLQNCGEVVLYCSKAN